MAYLQYTELIFAFTPLIQFCSRKFQTNIFQPILLQVKQPCILHETRPAIPFFECFIEKL